MSVTCDQLDMLHGTLWFVGTYSMVGIVLVSVHPRGHKAYIGSVPIIEPPNLAHLDALTIANYGCRITDPYLLRVLFPHVTEWYTG